MKVSVVIPNYNGADFLNKCLNSLEKNSLENEDFIYLNIIIIDNGSSDGTIEFLNNKIESNNIPNIDYYLISNSDNLGFSKAVNQGINLANTHDSKYVCLINNDVEIRR